MPDLTSARVLCDSTYLNGTRLTTIEAVFPRMLLSEVNTHKDPSRNSASSRAIPVQKQIQKLLTEPWVPTRFPMNQPGMSVAEFFPLGSPTDVEARRLWLWARDQAITATSRLVELGIHKGIANRLLEPFMWHTGILSATEEAWAHIFDLRCAPDAQPEFQVLANAIRDAIAGSSPKMLQWNEWHLPLTGFPGDEALSLADLIRVSVARVARVSYLTHEGVRDVNADIALFTRLQESRHLSPFEHAASPSPQPQHYANFHGWMQARKYVELGAPLPGAVQRTLEDYTARLPI